MIRTKQYQADVKTAAQANLNWEKLRGSKIFLTGATGMIGTFFVDVLLYRNRMFQDQIQICAATRNVEKAREQFKECEQWGLSFMQWDVTTPFVCEERFDYIVHGASNTHPLAYSSDPVGTITGNVTGLLHLYEHARKYMPKRVLLLSSVEIYGENTGNTEAFGEEDLGYLNCNTVRAGYPESKRLCESICQAYKAQYGIDFVIGRLSRVYGPTMKPDDSKALSQFIRKAVKREDIVLKSEGNQYYSYTYAADAAAALLLLLTEGVSGEAYNIADEKSDITLKELASFLAKVAGTKVVFELPDQKEKAGYSTATRAILDGRKIQELGYCSQFPIEEGLQHTVAVLREQGV